MASKRSRRLKNSDELSEETQSEVKPSSRAKRIKRVDVTVDEPVKKATKKKESGKAKKQGRKKKGDDKDVGSPNGRTSITVSPAKKKKIKNQHKSRKSIVIAPDSDQPMISSDQVLQGTSAETVFEGYSQGMPLNSTPLNRSIEKTPGSGLSQGKSPGQSKRKSHLVKSLTLSEKNRRLTYVAQTKEQRTERCDVFAKVCSELNGSLMDTVNSVNCFDSREAAKLVFQALISPTAEEHFFQTLWEKKPAYLMKRGNDYHKEVFSTAELYRILREHELLFTRNVDITTYIDGKRETHNPVGRAHAYTVQEFLQSGCSIRLLNPQTYSRGLWLLNSWLQEYFNSCVGSNVYLTPAGTQGFAPHFDDIEAFVLQLEGRKRWRLYKPRFSDEILPKESSRNFTEGEIGFPILDVILYPGDLLYFPRGTIHQAQCLPDTHSLHVTISTYQKNTWSDLLHKVLEESIQTAQQAGDLELRRGLPLALSSVFLTRSSHAEDERAAVVKRATSLYQSLVTPAVITRAVDKVIEGFLHDSLPPCLSEEESALTIVNCTPEDVFIQIDSHVKIVRFGSMRVLRSSDEQDFAKLVYNTENSREYHGKEIQFLNITLEEAEAIDFLLSVYPNWCKVEDIPLSTDEDKIDFSASLFSKSLLIHKRETG